MALHQVHDDATPSTTYHRFDTSPKSRLLDETFPTQRDTFPPVASITSDYSLAPHELNRPSPKQASSPAFDPSSSAPTAVRDLFTPLSSFDQPEAGPSRLGSRLSNPTSSIRSRGSVFDRDSPDHAPQSSRFGAFRRGSLMPNMLSSPIAPSTARRGSDPSTAIELGRVTSPRFTMAVSPPGISKDVMEVTTVPISRQEKVHMSLDREKEDQAMAKWRKWVVEQPLQPPPSEPSPSKSRRSSPSSADARPSTAPLERINTNLTPAHASSSRSPSRHNSGESAHSKTSSTPSRLDMAEFDTINTDTMRALRDVELAVDETVSMSRSASQPRRMSTNPRVSMSDNPFIDLSSRLSSRRVRPLVIELIQALGQYIDAVWSMSYPGVPCPWVEDATPDRDKTSSREIWRSKMLTAVQEGKRQGCVPSPQGPGDVAFWGGEVQYTLKDVDEVVGIYKGVSWAFDTAIRNGQYGEVKAGNVLRRDGSAGNLARLLNDLEEAIWGDAPPRPSDLAWELDIDFDPYAEPSLSDLAQGGSGGGGGGGLAAFFSSTKNPSTGSDTPSGPVSEAMYDVTLPELQTDTGSDVSKSPISPLTQSRVDTPPTHTKADPLGLAAFKTDGTELTLEEIGRRRHQEWLQTKQAQGW